MTVRITKHFDYLTPFSEATNDEELKRILVLKYPKACSKLETDAEFFASMVDDVRRLDAYRVIGFDSFDSFCEAELGRTIQQVDTIVSGVKALRAAGVTGPIGERQAVLGTHGGDRRSEKAREDQGANGTLKRGSNSTEFLAARLRRDHPEIEFNENVRGSVRAAARSVGLVKPPLSPLERVQRLLLKLDEAELRAVAQMASDMAEEISAL